MSAVSAEPEALDELAWRLVEQSAAHAAVGSMLGQAVGSSSGPSAVGPVALAEASFASRGLVDLGRSLDALARFVADVSTALRVADSTLDALGDAGGAIGPAAAGATGSHERSTSTYSNGVRRTIDVTTSAPWADNSTVRQVVTRAASVQDGFRDVAVDVSAVSVGAAWSAGSGASHRFGSDAAHLDVAAFRGASATGTASFGAGKSGLSASLAAAVQAGASVTVAAGVGSSLLGAHGSATAFVGARAEADGTLGIGKGGIDAEMSARALLGGSAEAEGAVDIAGVRTGGHAGVSYGLGAEIHADLDMGLDEISMKFDLGATIGLGVSLGVEVKVSPRDTAKAAGKVAKKAWKSIF